MLSKDDIVYLKSSETPSYRFLSNCKLNSSNLIGSLAVIMKLYYLPVAGNIGHVILL
jgi:hypothetical protein